MKRVIFNQRKTELRVMIETDESYGDELLEQIAMLIAKENRRRANGSGKRIGYCVELRSSRYS